MNFSVQKALFLMVPWILFVTAQVPETPVFPDIFSTEIEIDMPVDEEESDVSLFYDRTKNMAALHIRSQKEATIMIYDFGNDLLLTIRDKIVCEVSNITEENNMFFLYEENKSTGKKKLLSGKQFFRFPDPTPNYKATEDGVPLHIYTVDMDLPFYQRKDCTVKYMFTKKNYVMANCEYERCNSTLMGISINCPAGEDDTDPIDQLFRFFRFENYIPDYTVFQIPLGVHCSLPDTKPLPRLPESYRFYYDVNEVLLYVTDDTKKSRINEKSVTSIGNEVFVVDNLQNERLIMRKICDLSHGLGYAIDASNMSCTLESCTSHFDFKDVSQLPNLLFERETSGAGKAVYIGNRVSNGIQYDVWTTSEKRDSYHIVRELYYLQVPKTDKDSTLQLSHILEYTYEKNDRKGTFQLLQMTRTSAYRFSYTREWESFDLNPCFKDKNQRKEFEIQFAASKEFSILPGSSLYKQFIVALSMKLVSVAGISDTRLTEIKYVPASKPLTVRGAILEDPVRLGWTNMTTFKEKSLAEAFALIQGQVAKGDFTFPLTYESKAPPSIIKVKVFQEPRTDFVDEDDEVTYTKGAMAGLGFTTLFIGLIIGGILVMIYVKKTRMLTG